MSNRSTVILLIGALTGCVLVAVCAALLTGGYFFVTGDPFGMLARQGPGNRIAFVGNDTNIYVHDPAGGTTNAVTRDGGQGHAYNFPTWSPDNRRLAFVGYTITNGNPTEGAVITAAPSGDNLTPVYRTPVNFPFYLYWSPDSQFVSFLANKNSQSIALHIAQSDRPDSMQELDAGAPFYWAWSPDGSQMFTHVGGTRADSQDARLALVPFGASSTAQSLEALPGRFQAPQWSRDGRLLFSRQGDSGSALAIADAKGTEIQELVPYNGRASFAFSPDGSQVAYIVTANGVSLPHFGPVRTIAAAGGSPRLVSQEPAIAFLWSPDSTKLAFLTVSVGENRSNYEFDLVVPSVASTRPENLTPELLYQGGGNRLLLHWKVWDLASDETRNLASFSPTPSFLNVIPYFDQYANSSTFWSPDSKSFVYTAIEGEGAGSVWIADVSSGAPPRRVGDGVLAFWSWN
jgi:TolB protein